MGAERESRFLRVRHLLEYILIQSLLIPTRVLPLKTVLWFCEGITQASFLLMFRRRRIAEENILKAGICATPKEARRMARAAFRSFTVMVAETVVARRRLTAENWQNHVRLVLKPEVEAVLREPGQGIIAASAHIGNWEVAARAVSRIKPLLAIMHPMRNPYLNRMVREEKSGFNMRLTTKHDFDARRFLRSLQQGEVLAIMMDQHAGGRGIRVDFFGREVSTHASVALLHLVTRAPLYLAYALRTGPLEYEVHAVGPIEFSPTGKKDDDVFRITQSLTREIEKIVRRHPDQYMWGHRRWRY